MYSAGIEGEHCPNCKSNECHDRTFTFKNTPVTKPTYVFKLVLAEAILLAGRIHIGAKDVLAIEESIGIAVGCRIGVHDPALDQT